MEDRPDGRSEIVTLSTPPNKAKHPHRNRLGKAFSFGEPAGTRTQDTRIKGCIARVWCMPPRLLVMRLAGPLPTTGPPRAAPSCPVRSES
jgi:hypothetical protein